MKKLTVLTLVLTVIFSCTRHEPEKSCITDVASISGSYKITAYTYKENASAQERDIFSTVFPDACDRDNVIVFYVNGTYEIKDEGLVCSVRNEVGLWTMIGNTIQIDGMSMTIESFDCKKLILGYTGYMVAGDKLKITFIK
jgi:hypothetical protein